LEYKFSMSVKVKKIVKQLKIGLDKLNVDLDKLKTERDSSVQLINPEM